MSSLADTNKFEERKTTCPECGGTLIEKYVPFLKKWIRDKCECQKQREQKEEEQKKATEKLFKIQENKRESGIKPLYKNCTFDNYIADENTNNAKRLAQHYADKYEDVSKEGKGLIFMGNTGSGKTHLAAAIANSLLEKGVKVIFISYSNLILKINGANDYGATENKLVNKLQKCSLLVLDDIGITTSNEKSCAVLYSILDERINNFRPTVITSNIADLTEIKTKFNEQIYDRIKGNCYIVKIASPSYRNVSK